MPLLAGLRFVKKAPPGADDGGGGGGGSLENRGEEKSEGEKGRHIKHEKKKKEKKKDRGKKHKGASGNDADEPASKRRKSHWKTASSPSSKPSPPEGGGTDWIDEALAVGGCKGDLDEPTLEELAAKKREEEIDLEVVKGLRDPKTKRRYGLYDPLKGEQEEGSAASSAIGGASGKEVDASGSRGAAAGGVGLPAKFSAPVLTGVGDKGAGWRAKALKRAREKAEKSGQSLEEVVGER